MDLVKENMLSREMLLDNFKSLIQNVAATPK